MLSENEKIVLIKDFTAWAGATPDKDDRHAAYIRFGMPHSLFGKRDEVLKFFQMYAKIKQLEEMEVAKAVAKRAAAKKAEAEKVKA